MTPKVHSFFDKATSTATHVVSDPETGAALIIDPVLDYDAASGRTRQESADTVLTYVREQGLKVEWVLETHIHADHLSAAAYLKQSLEAQTGIGAAVPQVQKVFAEIYGIEEGFIPDGKQFDHLFADGEEFPLGSLTVQVLHTPGHTPACASYLIGDAVFVGDTIFMPDFGSARCDFPGGDARQLYRSVQRLLSLPAETRMFLCHDYAPGGREYIWETTVGAQKAQNIHMGADVSEDAFVEMRETRDATLNMPALILPSVQVNIRAGDLPPPDAKGNRYLKIPLNRM